VHNAVRTPLPLPPQPNRGIRQLPSVEAHSRQELLPNSTARDKAAYAKNALLDALFNFLE
jgi:hypothetical protein